MKLKELQEWIKNNLFNEKTGTLIPKMVSYNSKWVTEKSSIFEEIKNLTHFLDDDCPLNQRIYHILHNIFYKPKCVKCDNYVKYKKFSKGYAIYCCQKCVNKMRSEKFKEKYNKSHPLQIEKFKEKFRSTSIERYGVSNPQLNENVKRKSKQTNLERYGVESPLQVPKFKEKCCNTNIERYGVPYPQLNEDVRKKSVKTLEKKYGKGITNPFECNQVQEDIRREREERTGFRYNSQYHLTNIDKLNKEYIENNFIKNDRCFDLEEFQRFFNMSSSHSHKKLKEFGIVYENDISEGESKLREFIENTVGSEEIIYNDRKILKPKELDIYLPDFNLAIEYNGNYWHCEDHERIYPNFHLQKTEQCIDKGIFLFHIFEHQWKDAFKRDIFKSMILNKIKNNKKVHGRNCEVIQINNVDKDNFLNENHIQGTCNSSINIGLIYKNEIVSVVAFGKPRFNKKYDWELLRFCNKKFTTVNGGASKLFKYFLKFYSGNIITYADRSYSDGSLYEKLDFVLEKINRPSYFYFKNNKTLKRYQTQKKKLPYILQNFNINLTEHQNMLNNGYHRVWDCGTLVYKYTKEQY